MDKATRSLLNRSMAALADGERGAFDPVYRTRWPLLVEMIAGISEARMIAEEVAQQAMLKILGKGIDVRSLVSTPPRHLRRTPVLPPQRQKLRQGDPSGLD